jgi:hypothetical protein
MNSSKTFWRWFLILPLLGAVLGGRTQGMDKGLSHAVKAAGPSNSSAALATNPEVVITNTPLPPSPTPVPQIIIEEPEITPPFTDICSSGWLPKENTRGHMAYLALNVNEDQPATDSGQWRAALLQKGYYRVEAYIPSHESIDWDCPDLQKHISFDTSDARYTISYAEEQATVAGNQKPLSDEWLDLGEFLLEQPGDMQVELTNVTGEETESTTVSLSAVRFTWTRPPGAKAFLPLMKRAVSKVNLTSTWTSDQNNFAKAAFVPGEQIRFYASGFNTTGFSAQAEIEWTIETPCGINHFFSETHDLEVDLWSHYFNFVVPDCLGVYRYRIQVTFQDQISSIENYFVVNYASSAQISDRQAFDKCSAPEIDQMETWWHNSPYYTANLYIGGVHSSCSNSHLNAFWVHEVSQQGWNFIPTWVGPQAPCSRFIHRMSSNAAVAYFQGRDEADRAYEAAVRLGFSAGKAIYYDLEGYSGATTSCRNAVSAFMEGWSVRLHELGARAGAYGSACTSYMSDWASIDPPLDNVWIAHWISDSYDSAATVWDARCLSNDLWPDHQRLRQYAGDHRETWGGVSLTIDSNAADGEITTLNLVTPSRDSNLPVMIKPSSDTQLHVESFQMFTSQRGWAVSGTSLLKTDSGGSSWEEQFTPAGESGTILGSFFLDANRGWLVARGDEPGALVILRTQDGFLTSDRVVLPASRMQFSSDVQRAQIQFTDPSNGWVALKLQSSSNFSLGALLKTRDGGQTWQVLPLPVSGRLHFLNQDRGWLAGGVSGDDLYATMDGGSSWSRVRLAGITQDPAAQVQVSLPVFANARDGFLIVNVFDERLDERLDERGKRVILYKTNDSGGSWAPNAVLTVAEDLSSGSTAILTATPQGGVLALPAGVDLAAFERFAASEGLEIVGDLPAGVIQVSFLDPHQGWALVQEGKCTGDKLGVNAKIPPDGEDFQCSVSEKLVETKDGGATWRRVSP